MATTDVPPNQTIYVNNLYEKIPKTELKKCLHAMFSQFGKIMDVVCLKTYRLRGQAWIVYNDVGAATSALRSMQGFPFFEKPIKIQYARTESDAVAKLKGTYKEDKNKERSKKNAAATEQLLKRGKEKAVHGGGRGGADNAPPNKILFVEQLPENTNEAMVSMLFKQFPGFREVRMVEARPGIAFVEFENDMQSSNAMSGLQGFRIAPTHAMKISFAKQ